MGWRGATGELDLECFIGLHWTSRGKKIVLAQEKVRKPTEAWESTVCLGNGLHEAGEGVWANCEGIFAAQCLGFISHSIGKGLGNQIIKWAICSWNNLYRTYPLVNALKNVTDFRVKDPGFESHICPLQAMWPLLVYSTSAIKGG